MAYFAAYFIASFFIKKLVKTGKASAAFQHVPACEIELTHFNDKTANQFSSPCILC